MKKNTNKKDVPNEMKTLVDKYWHNNELTGSVDNNFTRAAKKEVSGGVTKADFNRVQGIVIGVAIVVGIGFITLLLTSYVLFIEVVNSKNDTYSQLLERLDLQNDRINGLDVKVQTLNLKK